MKMETQQKFPLDRLWINAKNKIREVKLGFEFLYGETLQNNQDHFKIEKSEANAECYFQRFGV